MNIANLFTFVRIFISPFFLLLYVEKDFFGISEFMLPFVLLFLLGISELSDALDGYFARKYDLVTDLGKIIDPMADSLCKISIFLAFTKGPVSIPLIFVFLFLYREAVVNSLRTLCAIRGFALAARYSGKVKTTMQAIVACIILTLMIPYSLGMISQYFLHMTSVIIVGITCLYSLISGAEYLYANRKIIKKTLTTKRNAANN